MSARVHGRFVDHAQIRLKRAPDVGGLREIPLPFQERGTRKRLTAPPLVARWKTVRIKEEQLVRAAGLADGSADRVAQSLIQYRPRIAVWALTQLFAFHEPCRSMS